jgi:hypothetical protein
VGLRAVLEAVVKSKILSPRRESNPRTPIVQLVAQRYTDWAITDLGYLSCISLNAHTKKCLKSCRTQWGLYFTSRYKFFVRSVILEKIDAVWSELHVNFVVFCRFKTSWGFAYPSTNPHQNPFSSFGDESCGRTRLADFKFRYENEFKSFHYRYCYEHTDSWIATRSEVWLIFSDLRQYRYYATDWTSRVHFPAGTVMRFCLFATAFRPALGPTQSPIQWVPVVKLRGHAHLVPRLRMHGVYLYSVCFRVVVLKHRNDFTVSSHINVLFRYECCIRVWTCIYCWSNISLYT